MAVVPTTSYLYVDQHLNQFFIQGSLLTDRGPWIATAFYSPRNVVQVGIDQYIALKTNSNQKPSAIIDANWSTLLIVSQSGSTSSASALRQRNRFQHQSTRRPRIKD